VHKSQIHDLFGDSWSTLS